MQGVADPDDATFCWPRVRAANSASLADIQNTRVTRTRPWLCPVRIICPLPSVACVDKTGGFDPMSELYKLTKAASCHEKLTEAHKGGRMPREPH